MSQKGLDSLSSIEDIILGRDRRGIGVLRECLPADFCADAARFVLDSRRNGKGTAVITTGFYITGGKAAETDGPPGAVVMGMALNRTGFKVIYVTDKHALPFLAPDIAPGNGLIEFPITDAEKSRAFAKGLIEEIRPDVIISTERCGACARGAYLNMRCRDISENTAKIDYLFDGSTRTVGIGDGGNEIGMGNLASEVARHANLTPEPPAAAVDRLIIASVSNWGACGLVAALSLLVGENLLPGVEWEKEFIREIVRRGAADGVSGINRPTVDGFSLEENALTLSLLNGLVAKRLKQADKS